MDSPIPAIPATDNQKEVNVWRNQLLTYIKEIVDEYLDKALFDANTILAATTDDTPAALTVAEQRLVGRITGGSIAALTGAQVRTMLGTNPFVVGSDADGDVWYRASGALARLAKGTANFKMFMNAGATAPEWANGIKLVTFTRDVSVASGTQAVTGVGFKGSCAIFLSAISGTTNIANIAFDDGTTHNRLTTDATTNWYTIATSSLMGFVSAGNYSSGYITAWDADGFTITWAKTGTPTGTLTVYALVLR